MESASSLIDDFGSSKRPKCETMDSVTLLSLPLEVLSHITSFFPAAHHMRLRLVCRVFDNAIQQHHETFQCHLCQCYSSGKDFITQRARLHWLPSWVFQKFQSPPSVEEIAAANLSPLANIRLKFTYEGNNELLSFLSSSSVFTGARSLSIDASEYMDEDAIDGTVCDQFWSHMTHLTTLSIKNWHFRSSCAAYTTDLSRPIQTIASSLPHLQSLDLFNCRIGNEGLQALCSSISSSNLTSLNLGKNNVSSASAFTSFCSNPAFANLKKLTLCYNYNMAQRAVIAIARSPQIKGLVELDLDGCNMTDAALKALIASPICSNLKVFRASYHQCSAEPLVSLLMGFPQFWSHLEELSLVGTTGSVQGPHLREIIERDFDPTKLVPIAGAKLKIFRFGPPGGDQCSALLSMLPLAAVETMELKFISALGMSHLCASSLRFPRLRDLTIGIREREPPNWMDWFSFCASSLAASLTRLVVTHREEDKFPNWYLDDKCLPAFYSSSSRLSRLQELALHGGQMSVSAGIPALIQAMPALQNLDLHRRDDFENIFTRPDNAQADESGASAERTADKILALWSERRADFKKLRLSDTPFGKEVTKIMDEKRALRLY